MHVRYAREREPQQEIVAAALVDADVVGDSDEADVPLGEPLRHLRDLLRSERLGEQRDPLIALQHRREERGHDRHDDPGDGQHPRARR